MTQCNMVCQGGVASLLRARCAVARPLRLNRGSQLDRRANIRQKFRRGENAVPTINLQCELTEQKAKNIEAMRGKMPEQDFLRYALILGLTDIQDEISRVSKEMVYNALNGQTKSYDKARRTANIRGPGEDDEEAETVADKKPPRLNS